MGGLMFDYVPEHVRMLWVRSGRSRVRAFINFPNNGGILCSCPGSIHSLSFWYQRTSLFFFEGQSFCSLHAVAKPRPLSLPHFGI